jgi:hypothetical protein
MDVMVMSSLAVWPVSSFSLLSNSTLATGADNASPKFEAGVVIQLCTTEVTSSVMYCPAVAAVKLLIGVPIVGIVA